MKSDYIYRWDKKKNKKVRISRPDFVQKAKNIQAKLDKKITPVIISREEKSIILKKNFNETISRQKRKKRNRRKTNLNSIKGAIKFRENMPFSERWFFNYLKFIDFPILDSIYLVELFGIGRSNVPVDNYILDIYNKKYKFIIEIDDSTHNSKKSYDSKRDAHFLNKGISTYRITFNDTESACLTIYNIVQHIISFNDSNKQKLLEWITLHKERSNKTVK